MTLDMFGILIFLMTLGVVLLFDISFNIRRMLKIAKDSCASPKK